MMPIAITDYRVLFDRQRDGYRASSASADFFRGRLSLLFMFASDCLRGVPQYRVESTDMGRTWSEPETFGPPLSDLENQFQAVYFSGRTGRGTSLLAGLFLAKGAREETLQASAWLPGEALIGRQEEGAARVDWTRHASGAFLWEQYVTPGLVTQSGRIVLTIWGAAAAGENWRCGVLLSDDDGRAWRYREVGYEPDPAIRRQPSIPAGFNEQSLFELSDGMLVSIIRGRERLGATDEAAIETYFFRSVSVDGGETWSKPKPTNLPGTGAPCAGLTLPDGSLLLPVRAPERIASTWVRCPDPKLYGLHVARSFDQGRTWRTEAILQHDSDGQPFDNYYNVMNGQFVPIGDRRWLYVFGHFEHQRDRHRALSLEVSCR